MSFFKRISATVTANIDRAVSQIENHDAVVEVALDEIKDATARLKVQLGRVKAETRRLDQVGAELKADEQRWTDRARRVAEEDESRALECLARRKECRAKLAHTEQLLKKNRELEHRLTSDFERLQRRLDEVNNRRQELRSRELSAKGTQVVADLNRERGMDVDRLFERWEVDVTRSEITGEAHLAEEVPSDQLADDFEKAEREADLKGELADLLKDEEADR